MWEELASYEENTREFLFPEPKLTPSNPGMCREVLMKTAAGFPVSDLCPVGLLLQEKSLGPEHFVPDRACSWADAFILVRTPVVLFSSPVQMPQSERFPLLIQEVGVLPNLAISYSHCHVIIKRIFFTSP